MDQKTDSAYPIKREILTYLGKLPQLLKTQGNAAAAETALQLGNCLLWIAPKISPGEHKVEQPIDEPAQTLYALGKQFRQIALSFMDRPETCRGTRDLQQMYLEGRIDDLQERLNKIEQGQI